MPSAVESHAVDPHAISTPEQLTSLFGEVGESSLKKEVAFVHPHYRALIEASPFAILATSGPDGLDASPRGDPPGFVVVEDEKTLLMPERRGNNRVDSLRNIIADPRVALLFLIPGVGETLRVNGRATITTAPALLQRFAVEGKLPKCLIVVQVEAVFFQCARAIQRSRLWQPVAVEVRGKMPSPGQILAALTDARIDGEKYDRELPARQRATLY
ncbi:MAG TPA: pyridoxamine 5'-phosphate oxidase family protein [Burkholderiaceae bacterium]|nr:pyridoxamine 5'-phosphate oxidase family protein [Burkholderiaceae bacterium]